MSRPRSNRWLGPAALAAALVAVLVVAVGSTGGDEEGTPPATGTTERSAQRGERSRTSRTRTAPTQTTSTTPEDVPETYRVRPGDNFGVIADRSGVSVEEIQRLNPTADSQSLTVGQEIKLRP